MDKFVACANIKHFHELLAKERDEAKRAMLLRLLAEEEAKLAAATETPPPDRKTPRR